GHHRWPANPCLWGSMSNTRRNNQTRYQSSFARIVAVLATALIAVVMLGTLLIVAPANTPARSQVTSVALPYFTQAWRIFAPEILKVNRSLEFRVAWRNEQRDLVT